MDFSEFSAKAYDYAFSLARHYDAQLFVQHVAEPALALYGSYISPHIVEDLYARHTAYVRERVGEFINKHPIEKIKAEPVIQLGNPADSILAFAEAHNIDLITMGTHGRRGLDRAAMGSTFERVVRKSRCAVLGVHEPVRDFVSPESPGVPVHLRRILWCTDLSENSPRVLEFALSLAFEYKAELTLLHVLEKAGDAGEERRSWQLLEEAIPEEARTRVNAVPMVLAGEPYQKIIEYATQAKTDLIVMSVRGRNFLDLAIFGSTTHRVIRLGPCPVLTVKT